MFEKLIEKRLPQLLTNLDRDEDSPTFGCFDRNFWHYKIRDFSSAILQQAGVSLLLADEAVVPEEIKRVWLEGVVDFWARLPSKEGGLNEYYPFEGSYPATAFSLQAMAWLLQRKPELMNEKVEVQMQRAARFLLENREERASNQEAAAISGLMEAKKLGVGIDGGKLKQKLNALLGLFDSDGWFMEYGGADLGYQSVLVDMLVDYLDAGGDRKVEKYLSKAVDFMDEWVTKDGDILTVINSRETDYVVPYGLVKLARKYKKAGELVSRVYKNLGEASHFEWACDERYLLHYRFTSVMKAEAELRRRRLRVAASKPKKNSQFFRQLRGWVKNSGDTSLAIAGAKGGAWQLVVGNETHIDYGYRVFQDGQMWLSMVQSDDTKMEMVDQSKIRVVAKLSKPRLMVASVWKNMLLRIVSFWVGRRMVGLLKGWMIFFQAGDEFRLEREFDLSKMRVTDRIEGSGKFEVCRAQSVPTRHVASAYNFGGEKEKIKGVVEVVEGSYWRTSRLDQK